MNGATLGINRQYLNVESQICKEIESRKNSLRAVLRLVTGPHKHVSDDITQQTSFRATYGADDESRTVTAPMGARGSYSGVKIIGIGLRCR
jgi:hypothetical protein